MYNQFVQGNAELLSISSNDSIWNSDDETEETSNAAPRNNPSKHTSKIRGLCLMKFSLPFLPSWLHEGLIITLLSFM